MRGEDRCWHERGDVLRIGRALLQPAPDRGEPGLLQPLFRFPRRCEDPGRPADELRGAIVRDRVDDLADAIDVALSAALNLEHTARPKRLSQSFPEAIMVG